MPVACQSASCGIRPVSRVSRHRLNYFGLGALSLLNVASILQHLPVILNHVQDFNNSPYSLYARKLGRGILFWRMGFSNNITLDKRIHAQLISMASHSEHSTDQMKSSSAKKQKRPRKSEVPSPPSKILRSVSDLRVEHWRKNKGWPTEAEEKDLKRFEDPYMSAMPRKSCRFYFRNDQKTSSRVNKNQEETKQHRTEVHNTYGNIRSLVVSYAMTRKGLPLKAENCAESF